MDEVAPAHRLAGERTGGCCYVLENASPIRRSPGCGTAASTSTPTGRLAAQIAKEDLRTLFGAAASGGNRHDVVHRLHRFYYWCAYIGVPEVTTLAETVEHWARRSLAFLQLRIANVGYRRQQPRDQGCAMPRLRVQKPNTP